MLKHFDHVTIVVRDVERLIPGKLVVLVDRSASMSVRDAALPADSAAAWTEALGLAGPAELADLNRHEVVRRVLALHDFRLPLACARANDVQLMSFAEGVRPLVTLARSAGADTAPGAVPRPLALPEWRPDGALTDLGGALGVEGIGALGGEEIDRHVTPVVLVLGVGIAKLLDGLQLDRVEPELLEVEPA